MWQETKTKNSEKVCRWQNSTKNRNQRKKKHLFPFPFGVKLALFVVGIVIQGEQNLQMLLATWETNCQGSESGASVSEVAINSVWTLNSKSLCLGHALLSMLSAIQLFSYWKLRKQEFFHLLVTLYFFLHPLLSTTLFYLQHIGPSCHSTNRNRKSQILP